MSSGGRAFPSASGHVNAEAGQDNAVARDQDRDGFGRRDVRIELEIDTRPAVKMAWDIGPFFDRAEAIAHGGKVGASPPN